MIVQVVTLEVHPDRLADFLIEAQHNIVESKKESGVVQFDLLQLEDEPHKFMFYEVYKTKQALEAHRLSAHYMRWIEKGVPILTGERMRSIYTFVE